MTETTHTGCLGIIAGQGDIPQRVMTACQQQQRPFLVITLSEEANASQYQHYSHVEIPIAKVGHFLEVMRAHNVEEVVMVGHIKRPVWKELVPDSLGMKLLAKIITKKVLGDDTVLSTVVHFLEQHHIRVVGVDTILKDLVAPKGVWGNIELSSSLTSDIDLGKNVLLNLSPFDIGQAVIVYQGQVLGIEGPEGTDQLIHRCALYRKESKGGILIKMKKRLQERRVDLPTIGVSTIIHAHEAGLVGIVVEAGECLVVEKEAVVEQADSLGIVLVGI
ncbi:MAG: UDP-2,3-diacylglucosamine diphosphatase LpxI [Alphaproteobacteria bacterium]|nr:UDP-2,3-diacylglucosamine diphosphatase LpxI [Alphaproteobacteria bacterium]